jgi:hypothetical protein
MLVYYAQRAIVALFREEGADPHSQCRSFQSRDSSWKKKSVTGSRRVIVTDLGEYNGADMSR